MIALKLFDEHLFRKNKSRQDAPVVRGKESARKSFRAEELHRFRMEMSLTHWRHFPHKNPRKPHSFLGTKKKTIQ